MYYNTNVDPVCHPSLRTKPLMNMAFLYSCDTGTYGSYWQNALGLASGMNGTLAVNREDAVLFCFGKAVWTKLKPNDTTAELIVPPAQASTILSEKLSKHSELLLDKLSQGDKATSALSAANNAYPPRHFAGLDGNGDGRFQLLNMQKEGDGEATLKKVYRRSTETPEVATDWYLVFEPSPS
ncbi:MAG: hypothetical protein WD716_06140 [Fimbriimonadaceae bacterium]